MKHHRAILESDLVSALAKAFRSADACHCHTVPKLSYLEVVSNLIEDGVLDPGFREAARGVDADQRQTARDATERAFAELREVIGFGWAWDLARHHGIPGIEYLCSLSISELMDFPKIGYSKARQIERDLARHGYYLADSDHEALAAEIASEDKGESETPPAEDASPEEKRRWAANRLNALGKEMLNDGTSLVDKAFKVERSDTSAGKVLAKYVQAQRFGHGVVARIMDVLKPLEEAEKAEARAAREVEKSKRLSRPDMTNVVTLQRTA